MKKILYIALVALFALSFTAQSSVASNPYAKCRYAKHPKRCYLRIKNSRRNVRKRVQRRETRRIVKRAVRVQEKNRRARHERYERHHNGKIKLRIKIK